MISSFPMWNEGRDVQLFPWKSIISRLSKGNQWNSVIQFKTGRLSDISTKKKHNTVLKILSTLSTREVQSQSQRDVAISVRIVIINERNKSTVWWGTERNRTRMFHWRCNCMVPDLICRRLLCLMWVFRYWRSQG